MKQHKNEFKNNTLKNFKDKFEKNYFDAHE